jgi:hypothetical protein
VLAVLVPAGGMGRRRLTGMRRLVLLLGLLRRVLRRSRRMGGLCGLALLSGVGLFGLLALLLGGLGPGLIGALTLLHGLGLTLMLLAGLTLLGRLLALGGGGLVLGAVLALGDAALLVGLLVLLRGLLLGLVLLSRLLLSRLLLARLALLGCLVLGGLLLGLTLLLFGLPLLSGLLALMLFGEPAGLVRRLPRTGARHRGTCARLVLTDRR